MPQTVTHDQLEDKGACRSEVEKFRLLFGCSVDVTTKLAVSHARVFDWNWARCLLDAKGEANYNRSRVAALKLWDLKVYKAKVRLQLLCREYERCHGTNTKEYHSLCSVAWSDHRSARTSILKIYESTLAKAWAEAYLSF